MLAHYATETIETLIDHHGLLHVLTALECICSEKAEHIRVNWQDCKAARSWDKASGLIRRTASRVETLNI